MPWAENVIDHKDLVHQVQSQVCTHVWGKEKLITPKLNKLLKHNNYHECKVSMLKHLFEFNGLWLGELVNKLVNMCYAGNLFQGHWTGVTLQFKETIISFLNGVHCFAHKTNLAMATLLELDFVHWLKGILQRWYAFFTYSPKKFTKFYNLVNLLNTKSNKLL
jgi:hypothetical protein